MTNLISRLFLIISLAVGLAVPFACAAPAFATETARSQDLNLQMQVCELALTAQNRVMTLDQKTRVEVAPDEVFVRGSLSHEKSSELQKQSYWLITDEFLSRQLLPMSWIANQQLSNGDRIFLFDENGQVRVKGYYGEKNYEPKLYADKELTQILVSSPGLRDAFYSRVPAAAIIRLNDTERNLLDSNMHIGRERFDLYRSNGQRFVSFAGQQIEPAYFEVAQRGVVKHYLRHTAQLSRDEVRRFGGEEVYLLDAKLETEKGTLVPIREGDRLVLGDDPKNILVLGSRETPLYGTLKQLQPLRIRLSTKEAPAALLLQNPVRKPKL